MTKKINSKYESVYNSLKESGLLVVVMKKPCPYTV